MTGTPVRVDIAADGAGGERIATLTIDRPDVLNAFDSATRAAFVSAAREVQADDVRAVVVTGAGDRAFSAGQDIDETAAFGGGDADEWVAEFESLYESVLGFDVPVVAAVNGVAVGLGFQIALLCDVRIAARDAAVGVPELDVGLPCVLGGYLIETLAGAGAAAELALTAETVDAPRARELGLLTRVVPPAELDDAVAEMVETLAEKPPRATASQKAWLRRLRFDGELSAVLERGRELHADAYDTGEPAARMAQFRDGGEGEGGAGDGNGDDDAGGDGTGGTDGADEADEADG